jgi:hypothetical protein
MDRLQSMRVFQQVVEEGGFAAQPASWTWRPRPSRGS